MGRARRTGVLTALIAAVALPAGSASATSITLGPSTELPPVESFSLGGSELLSSALIGNTSPGSGTTLTAPADGTVSSWRVVGGAQHGSLKLEVLTPGHPGATTRGDVHVLEER